MPAAPAKVIRGYALAIKPEGSYGGGGSPGALSVDGIQCDDLPVLKLSYANSGERPVPPATGGSQRGVVPSGLVADLTLKVAPKGASSAYAAATFPNIHRLALAGGMTGVVTTTPGLEKWVYTPFALTDTITSDVANVFERGQQYNVTGLLGDWTLSAKGPEVPVFEFIGKGLGALPTDASVPAPPYPNQANDPPKATNLTLTYAGVVMVVRSFTLKYGRKISPRLDVNASGGHGGFWGVTRVPTFEVEVETPAIATLNLFSKYDTASVDTLTLTSPGVQYNRWNLSLNVQMHNPPEESADQDVAISKLMFRLIPTVQANTDELTWTFN